MRRFGPQTLPGAGWFSSLCPTLTPVKTVVRYVSGAREGGVSFGGKTQGTVTPTTGGRGNGSGGGRDQGPSESKTVSTGRGQGEGGSVLLRLRRVGEEVKPGVARNRLEEGVPVRYSLWECW